MMWLCGLMLWHGYGMRLWDTDANMSDFRLLDGVGWSCWCIFCGVAVGRYNRGGHTYVDRVSEIHSSSLCVPSTTRIYFLFFSPFGPA